MKGTMVIEFEYDEEDVSLIQLERRANHWITTKCPEVEITHLEASAGDMAHAFGIGDVSKMAALEAM